MTPDFALSLLFQGIRLHRRTPEGWALVGEVPLDSADLAGDLAALREAGIATGTPWQGTRLLLPPEQVRTLALAGERDEGVVLAALEGMTPYAVADLVVDHVVAEGRTHVAAVARETLDEAEAFADQHGFRPVAFGAPLEDFPREASFGPTRLAATFAQDAAEQAPADAPPEPWESPEPAGADVPLAPDADAAPAAPETDEADPISVPEAPPLPEDLAPEILAPEPLAAEAAFEAPPTQDATPPEAASPDASAAPTDVSPAMMEAAGPSPDGRAADPAEPAAPIETPDATDAPAPTAALAEDAAPPAPAPEPIFASRTRPLGDGAREAAPVLGSPEGARKAQGRRAEPSLRKPPAEAWALTAPAASARPDPRVPPQPTARRPEPAVVAAPPADAIQPVVPRPAPRGESLGLFGSDPRQTSRVGGKPRLLGLVLTVLLLVAMAAVAVLASVSEQGLAGLFRRPDPIAVAAAPPATPPGPAEAAPAPAPETLASAEPEAPPLLATPPISTATGPAPESVASAAPQAPPLPDPAAAETATARVAAAIAGLAAPDDAARPAEAPSALEPPPAATDAALAETASPARTAEALLVAEPPQADPVSAAGADPLSPAEADRVYAATGVWLRAPRLPLLPGAEDATPGGADLPALSPAKALAAPPVLTALGPDAGMPTQFDPPGPGDTLPRDERGLVLATPDGTLAPSGVLLFAGSPAKVPPGRPASEAASTDLAEAPATAEMQGPPAPESLDAATTGAAAPAAEAAPPAATWANAMAEPPASLPPARPAAPAAFPAALPAAGIPGTPGALAFADTAMEGPPTALAAAALAGARPAPRPGDLSPPEGFSPPPVILAAYDGPRPGPRPEALAPEEPQGPDVAGALEEALTAPALPATPAAPDLQSTLAAIVEGAPDPLAGATSRAVAVARVPDARPRNFDRVVQRQLDRIARAAPAQRPAAGGLTAQEQAEAGEAETASAAAAVPTGPTPTSVARAATSSDAMRLREINLIGVYGQPGARRALVRTGNGRYLRVGIGDALDGGQVTAIGDNALNYVRRGRTEVLVIPGG